MLAVRKTTGMNHLMDCDVEPDAAERDLDLADVVSYRTLLDVSRIRNSCSLELGVSGKQTARCRSYVEPLFQGTRASIASLLFPEGSGDSWRHEDVAL